jgi:hypothetical protein
MNQKNTQIIEQNNVAAPSERETEEKYNKELLSPKAGTATSSPDGKCTVPD